MLALSGTARAATAAAAPPLFLADALWPAVAAQTVPRGRALYAEGDPARHWYRLLSGSMRLSRLLRDGRRHIAEFVFPGQFFGLEAGEIHSQAAEAIEPAGVAIYERDRIERRAAEDSLACQAVANLLLARLAAANERIMALGRLAALLLETARRSAKADPEGLVADLPMSRADIADYLGLTVETVSRVFTGLRVNGAIRLPTANRVEILAPAALEAACGGAGRKRNFLQAARRARR